MNCIPWGDYDPAGQWMPESDHRTTEEAAARVHRLNGGNDDIMELKLPETKEYITAETAIALAKAIYTGEDNFGVIDLLSQKLQALGFEEASKAIDCAFDI